MTTTELTSRAHAYATNIVGTSNPTRMLLIELAQEIERLEIQRLELVPDALNYVTLQGKNEKLELEVKRLTRIEMWAKRVTKHKGYGGYDLQAAYGGLEKALQTE